MSRKVVSKKSRVVRDSEAKEKVQTNAEAVSLAGCTSKLGGRSYGAQDRKQELSSGCLSQPTVFVPSDAS